MNRRDFLNYSGVASLLSSPFLSASALLENDRIAPFNNFKELLHELVQLNDSKVFYMMDLQENDPDSDHYGGVMDTWDIFNPGSTAGLIKTLTCSVSQQNSKYFMNQELLDSIEKAIQYLLNIQHSDGTIDLLSTNFHSTPDTGFVVEPLCACFHLLKGLKFVNREKILSKFEEFLRKAGEALVTGGIHTPNHRWVVSMALARLNLLFPDQKYVNRIDQWLNEGIDIDVDGQYEEKSTYIYTPLTNRCFVYLSKMLYRPELLDPVRKNLDMTMYYVHPNGEIATEASGRQDQFRVGFMEHYYLPLRYMAIKDKNGQYAQLVRNIEKTIPEKLLSYLVYLLEDKDYGENLPQSSNLSDNYTKEFSHSNLVRIRRGNIDATLLGENPTFLTLSKGKAVLASVRLATAFFGRGQFKAEKILRTGNRFVLNWKFEWGYFQPLPKRQKANYDIPFDEDRKRRKRSEVQELKASITISENNGVFMLDFDIKGTDRVPLAIEFACRTGGKLEGVEKHLLIRDSYLFTGKPAYYKFENDTLKFETEKSEHLWTTIRGGLSKPDADCIYLTGFTPFRKKVKIG